MTLYVSGLSACHCNICTRCNVSEILYYFLHPANQNCHNIYRYMEKEFAANTLARIRNRSADGTVLPVVVRVGMKVRLVVERLT